MSRKCVVPSCQYRQRKYKAKEVEHRSIFSFPKDEDKVLTWITHIPGVNLSDITSKSRICEIHFESKYLKQHFDKNTKVMRSRLTSLAIPTIFSIECYMDYQLEPSVVFNDNSNDQSDSNDQSFYGLNNNCFSYECMPNISYNQSLNVCEMETSILNNLNYSVQQNRKSAETSLQDIVKDLSASEHLLMDIKKEMFNFPEEDDLQKVKDEIKELTVYEQLRTNFNNCVALLPESWEMSQLPLGNDDVFAFSKECTISENNVLIVMYEKNIVLNREGNIHFSVHGKTLNNDSFVAPSVLKDFHSLLEVITKFNSAKVCQGISSNEFEVDKEFVVYKDDLGYCRHVSCTLLTEKQQCNFCKEYSQNLIKIIAKNSIVYNKPALYC